jgi:hypothetical protein
MTERYKSRSVWHLSLAGLALLLAALACGSPVPTPESTYTPQEESTPTLTSTPEPTDTPEPTYTPLPTYTPFPTWEPLPTYTPAPCSYVVDLAQDTAFADAINDYREANGRRRLNTTYYLAYIAVSRVQLTMVPGINLSIV